MKANPETIKSIVATVNDPEVPVLSVYDLGIVREIICADDGSVEVQITPTYSGCPAMDAIAFDIKMKLLEAGYRNCKIVHVLSPAWTTDWMTEAGKEKLKAYGIAPPVNNSAARSRLNRLLFEEETSVPCPHCQSTDTKLLSQFGSTACKALYQCNVCKEPFDYFKCH